MSRLLFVMSGSRSHLLQFLQALSRRLAGGRQVVLSDISLCVLVGRTIQLTMVAVLEDNLHGWHFIEIKSPVFIKILRHSKSLNFCGLSLYFGSLFPWKLESLAGIDF